MGAPFGGIGRHDVLPPVSALAMQCAAGAALDESQSDQDHRCGGDEASAEGNAYTNGARHGMRHRVVFLCFAAAVLWDGHLLLRHHHDLPNDYDGRKREDVGPNTYLCGGAEPMHDNVQEIKCRHGTK